MKIVRAPSGVETIETECVEKCTKSHRIDEHHPEYVKIKAQLLVGDRSSIFCYHELLELGHTAAPRHRN
jgi:hypothetical protein